MRPLLLGMNNPHHRDPRFDLYPAPKNCTGWRIWKMLNDRTGATKLDYVRSFDRCNLVNGRSWQRSGDHMFPYVRSGTTVVLFGEEVRRAMNKILRNQIKKILIHPQVVDGIIYRCVPHPSGLNRFYNDPASRELVAMLLEDLYDQAQKTKEKQHS